MGGADVIGRGARSLVTWALSAALAIGWAEPARAGVPLRAFEALNDAALVQRLTRRGSLFASTRQPFARADFGVAGQRWVALEGGRSLLRGSLHGAESLRGSLQGAALQPQSPVELSWSPPRHLLLDRARETLGLPAGAAPAGATGQGVVIGIIDAGVDVSHPDLRNADGSTRVAWWIDFDADPAGRHPELEAALGCMSDVGLRCQILDARDLDELLNNDVNGDEPRDPIGHGTHVASIAAGNGSSGARGFIGVAPEAALIVARVTGRGGTIADSDVVLATGFVFERAAELGMPAVVNLSLGSDFGPHDGSAELAQILAAFVGPEQPGRAIAVAAGNSGALLQATDSASEAFGIHTEREVNAERPGTLSIQTPPAVISGDQTDASIFVWLSLYPPGALSIGLTLPDGTRLAPIAAGRADSVASGPLVGAVLNGVDEGPEADAVELQLPLIGIDGVKPPPGSAVVIFDGSFDGGSTFTIDVEGQGRVEAWLQSEGDLAPELSATGAVFPAATARQTITIPATHPDLIAVGATVNRLDWTAADGALVSFAAAADSGYFLGAPAPFSSAGPNASGDVKPDLLAPGGFVIAALASAADPRRGGRGVFSGLCQGAGCQVISEGYAITAGTSMAAPMVSGALALLLEREPLLHQAELRSLLQAGSLPAVAPVEPVGRGGGGVLDAGRALRALGAAPRASREQPAAAQSRVEFASEFVLPDPARSVAGLVWLRDAEGEVFDAALDRLALRLSAGVIREPLTRAAPGLYAFRVAADELTPRAALRASVTLDGAEFLVRELPSSEPLVSSGGGSDDGCGLARSSAVRALPGAWYWALVAGLARRRLRSRRGKP